MTIDVDWNQDQFKNWKFCGVWKLLLY